MKLCKFQALYFLCATLFVMGCGREKGADEFWIEGRFANYGERSVVLERLEGSVVTSIDSTKTDGEGRFSFIGKVAPNTLMQVKTADRKVVLLVPGTAHLILDGDVNTLPVCSVKGDALNEVLQDFREEQTVLYQTYMTESRKLNSLNRESNLEAWRRAEAGSDTTLMAYQAFLRGFADTVSFPILRGIAAMSLMAKEDYHHLQKLTGRLEKELPGHPITVDLRGKLNKEKDKFYAIEVPNFGSKSLSGKEVQITDFRGKVVLFYVWASYCEYSRRENVKLAELFRAKEYENFEIVDYSIDDNEVAWRQAVAADSLPWAHHLVSSDGWNCPPVSELGVRSIPFTYLLDARGILRSKCLFSADLEEDLDSLVVAWK